MSHVDVTSVDKTGLATEVRAAWDRADDQLLEVRANYWLNLAFFLGYQWVWWNNQRRNIETLNRRHDGDRVMAKHNMIRPRIKSLLGRLSSRPLTFEIRPTAVDDATLQSAKIAERVLEARRVDDDWEELRTDSLFSGLMGGTTLVLPDWDPKAEEVQVESFNIAEFTLEPGTRRPRDARWMILARAMPPDQIKAHYGLDWEPGANSATDTSPVQRRLIAHRGMNQNVELGVVYQYFQRPDRDGKGGRVATVVDDKVVEYEDWPYPFDHLPGYVFRADIVPQQWYGETMVNDARPVQAAYNAIRSTMLENAKLAGTNRLMVPIGSGMDDFEFSDTPGEIVPFIPDNQVTPYYLQAPSLPRDFRYETERLEGEMDTILFTHSVTRGKAPGDRNSGLALSILAEKDDTPLGTMARDQQHGWSTVASQVVQLYADKVTSKRTARIANEDVQAPVTVEWTGDMLGNEHDAFVPLDAVMPHSKAAMQAMLVELAQTFPGQFQNLDQSTFLRLMDLPGAEHLRAAMDDDVRCAMEENHLMMSGEIALPETWHDHAVHIAEHNRERNSSRYRLADEETRSVIDDHIVAHEKLAAEEVGRTRSLNAAMPGLGAMPSADERMGSLMPRDHIDGGMELPPAMPAGPRPPA